MTATTTQRPSEVEPVGHHGRSGGAWLSLSKAMLKGFVRDRAALFFTILFPLLFLILFGGLFKDGGVSKSKVLEVGQVQLLDGARSDADVSKVLAITKTGNMADAIDKVKRGDYDAAVSQDGNRLVVNYSRADAVRAGTVQGVLNALVSAANQQGTPPKYTFAATQVEDKSLKAIQYVTPGILSWAIATGATFGAALTLVTWRQKKILRRLRLSPVRTSTVVGSRLGVQIIIGLVQMAIFLGVALVPYFGLKLSKDWWMAIPVVICGILAFLSIGLLAGARAKTPETAQVIANLIVLPMAFLSGAFFPLDNAPKWLQSFAEVLPMRHVVDGMTKVMVRDQPWTSALPEMGILLGFALVLGAIATRLFSWDDI